MTLNESPLDRALRIGGGFFLFATPALELHTAPYNLIGLAFIASGFIGFCPVYALFKIHTPFRSRATT